MMHSCITPVLCVTRFFRNHSNMPNIWILLLVTIIISSLLRVILCNIHSPYTQDLHTSATVGHKMSASNLNKHYEESFMQNYAFGHTFLPYQGPVSLFPKQILDISIQSHLQWQQKREMTWCWTWLRLLSWAKGRYWNVRKSQTYL